MSVARACLLLPLLLTGCVEEEPAGPERFTATPEGRLLGPDGREMLLRGLNARVEGLFDVDFDDGRTSLEVIPPFTGDDCGVLAGLGLNLLRLPLSWSAIEPERGVRDEAYTDRVVALVEACRERGVFTLVDMHQDAYSKHIGEDGAPLWAIVPPPDELLEGPLEDLADRRTSAQVLRSFRSFFDDAEGIQGAFAETTAWVAGRLDGTPGLVAIELFNEPVAFDDEKLDAMHRRVATAVREAAPDLPVAFEPDAVRNFNDSDPVTWPRPTTNAIYAPHHYTDVFTDHWASGDVASLRASVAGIADEAARHEAHGFVGEFGNDLDADNGLLWFQESLAAYDEHRLSWAMWVYEEWSQDAWGLYDFTDDGSGPRRAGLRDAQADLVARPFPHAIAGTLEGLSWDAATATLTVEMTGDGTHTLGAPERVWPSPPSATCDGAAATVTPTAPGRVDVECAGRVLVVSP